MSQSRSDDETCLVPQPKPKSGSRPTNNFSASESQIIAEACRHYQADWKSILEYWRLSRDRLQCENHIAYLRKKKNTLLSPHVGKRLRVDIAEDHEPVIVDDVSDLSKADSEFHLPAALADVDAMDREVIAPAVSSSSVTNVDEIDAAHQRTSTASEVRTPESISVHRSERPQFKI